VHGDAKAANIVFSDEAPSKLGDGQLVAGLVDFAYVGRGHPMKDIAYLLGCSAADGEAQEQAVLLAYHTELCHRLSQSNTTAAAADGDALAPDLRSLQVGLELAYADFARFMAGWGWWCSSYIAARTRRLLDQLDHGEEGHAGQFYEKAMHRAFPLHPQ
jgi:thiamine kinase-like enzyme